ncbi:MAG: radical SAM family heme chaperone HemW [Bacteroidales bacterium]|jgi:oxygen-independent coproporphyrinogen-3 oxidase|nr:radical SAM family heme chaperone HemW [Bacteroidales bacterium]
MMAGIYIHIPFCRKLCAYCDFYHLTASSGYDNLLEALVKEAGERRSYLAGGKVSTLYIGGGTPSVLSVEELTRLIRDISAFFEFTDTPEITVELNPDDITEEYSLGLKDSGINRVSLGIQSWSDSDLIMLNRRHDSNQSRRALEDIFKAGFENVSVDLIYGLPGMTDVEWARNLDITFSYGIKHLSAYHLTIEKGTVFNRMKERGVLKEIDEEDSAVQFQTLIGKSADAGFIQYEISNFGKPGFFSVHNTNYWRQVNYLGLGPSAHSFNGYSRQWNIRDLNGYIRALNTGKEYYEREELDTRTRFNEYILTSLRTMWGIDLEYVEAVFEKEGYDYVKNMSGKFIDYGLMRLDKKNLVLTDQGKLISDNIISEFMLV